MATAAQVIRAILQEIIVQESEQDIEAPEAQDAIFAMNNYMTALDAQGVSLGYTIVQDLGDDITIPDGALQGLVMNVAMVVAGQFGAEVRNTTAQAARMGMDAMRKLGINLRAMDFPCTLPVGSGNDFPDSGFDGDHFFHCEDDEVLTEQGGSILLEENTNASL